MSNQDNSPVEKESENQKIDVLNRYIDLQFSEAESKKEEIEFRKLEESHAFEYASTALKTQADDRKDERGHIGRIINKTYILAGLIILMFTIFLIIALFLNKEQIVMEIIRAVVYILTGGAGGFAIGRVIRRRNVENNEEE